MSGASGPDGAGLQVTELAARYAALRQAARSRGAQPHDVLDAAFTELEGAIELLRAAEAGPGGSAGPAAESQPPGSDNAERSLLRAAFQDTPVPLFLLTRDGTVQRVNKAAGDLIGAKPGYATGRPFTAFVNLPSRAAVNSQLTAVTRTGKQRRISCSLLAEDGIVPSELIIGKVAVRGEADPLMIAVRAAAGPRPDDGQMPDDGQPSDAAPPDEDGVTGRDRSRLGAVQAITRRLDLVTAVARLLLENEGFSESRTLQRCARLIAGELTAWVIVDLERRHRVRRQFVLGPDDVGPGGPGGSFPGPSQDSGRPPLIARAEDAGVLGDGLDGEPLLVKLDATSVLSVPLSDAENRYGVLTLVRRARDGHFKVADLALVEELGQQMALAIRVDRTFRRRSDTADALQASLLPRKWPGTPGLEIAATYIAAAEDPEVGGDFYDVYRTPDGWGLAVGDVCGKGEEGARGAGGGAVRDPYHRAALPRTRSGAGRDERDRAGRGVRPGRWLRHRQRRPPELAGRQAAGGHRQRRPSGRDPAPVRRPGPDDERRRASARAFPRRRARHPGAGDGSRRRAVPLHRRGGSGPRSGPHLLPGPAGRRAHRPGRLSG